MMTTPTENNSIDVDDDDDDDYPTFQLHKCT